MERGPTKGRATSRTNPKSRPASTPICIATVRTVALRLPNTLSHTDSTVA